MIPARQGTCAPAEGRTNAAIAEQVHVSVSAIEKQARAIFDKLDLHLQPGEVLLAILRYLSDAP